MTYYGHIRNGQILLDEPAQLPEGAVVQIDIVPPIAPILPSKNREKLKTFQPVIMPGGSLADELVNDRR